MYIRRSDYPILRDTRTLRKAYLLRAVPPLFERFLCPLRSRCPVFYCTLYSWFCGYCIVINVAE